MGRGKKFDAAEKHFQEKELKWRKLMKQLQISEKDACEKAGILEKENTSLKEEVEKLKAENAKLKELIKLPEADLNKLLDEEEHKRTTSSIINFVERFGTQFGI